MTAIATVFTAIISYKALSYARKEYDSHKQREESEVLSSFNERYSTDDHIAKVMDFLTSDVDESEGKSMNSEVAPTINDREMFMRFFEELQYAIEQKRLSKQIACDMFAYYALEVDKLNEKFVEDYYHSSWSRFRRFVKEMKRIKNNHNI